MFGVVVQTEVQRTDSRMRGRFRRLASRLRGPLAVVCCWVCLIGIVVRLTVRDQYSVISVVYYCLPPVVLAGFACLASGIWFSTRRRALAAVAGTVGLFCLMWHYQTAHFRNQTASSASAGAAVMFWNVAHGVMGWPAIVEDIRSRNPSLVGLVEAGRSADEVDQNLQQRFPEFNVLYLGRGMVVFSKDDVKQTGRGPLANGGRYAIAETVLDGRPITVVVVDIRSKPLMSRREPLEALNRVLSRLGDRPVLLMGDFNTPTDSVHLTGLRRKFVNAFETGGNGFAATWPSVLPVIAIDQVWVRRHRMRVTNCKLGWSVCSDHRPVLVKLAVVRKFETSTVTSRSD